MNAPLKSEFNERNCMWLDYLTTRYPILAICRESIQNGFLILKNSFQQGGKLLICGNGGSATDAEHICSELMKGFLKKRPLSVDLKNKLRESTKDSGDWVNKLQGALPAISLGNNIGLTSAICNDQESGLIFAQQVLGYGCSKDVLLAISTSGNSDNIANAVIVANCLSMRTLGLTGTEGGKLNNLCEVVIKAPASRTHQIQELHLPIYHTLCAMLEEEFFK